MKLIIGFSLITSVVCCVLAIVMDRDWTEAMAWGSLALYNTRDFINTLLNDR